MLLIINIIILIHSTKKKLQKLFKKFTYGLFKLLYGKINGYEDIGKISDSKVLYSEINNNFKYKVYIIKHAKLYTDTINDTAYIHDQKIIEGPSFQIRNTNFSHIENNIVLEKGTPRFQKVLKGKVLSLLSGGAGNYNYWHWLFDILPRIKIVENKFDLNDIDYFLLPNNSRRFQKETLELIDIPKKKQLSSLEYRHIKADEIIASDHPYVTGNNATSAIQNLPEWIIDWLRDKFTKNLNLNDSKFPTKFYIDRGDASPNISKLRQIINEKEVIDKLSKHNFKVIKLSDHSFKDQIKLFFNAKKIVGLHGAGFANVMFGNPELKMLELKSSGAGKMCENLAKKCNVNYDCISVVPEKYNFNNQMGHIRVDLNELENKL